MSPIRTSLKRVTMLLALAAFVVLPPVFAAGCRKADNKATTTGQPSTQIETKPKWDYSQERGPEKWGELSPDYILAAIGGSQSPIDIVTEDVIQPICRLWISKLIRLS